MPNRAFTLIELLVVIAIMGLLASVVLTSTINSKNKGRDATLQVNLHALQENAALYFNKNETYGTAVAVQTSSVTSTPNFNASSPYFFLSDLPTNTTMKAAFFVNKSYVDAIGSNGDSYAIAMKLANGTSWWCIDSEGKSALKSGSAIPALGGGTNPAACP